MCSNIMNRLLADRQRGRMDKKLPFMGFSIRWVGLLLQHFQPPEGKTKLLFVTFYSFCGFREIWCCSSGFLEFSGYWWGFFKASLCLKIPRSEMRTWGWFRQNAQCDNFEDLFLEQNIDFPNANADIV